jgi:hypothetical protein
MLPCNKYECEDVPLGINRCSDGLFVYVNESLGRKVVANITVDGKVWCISTEVQCGGLIKIDWKPADYLAKGEYTATLGIKDLNNNTVAFPFGDTCEDVCGIEFVINNSCNEGYKHINSSCGVPASYSWAIPVYNCSWKENIKNCFWSSTTTQMINKIKYGTNLFNIQSNPILVTTGVVSINPAYEAELELIEASAFMVDLVGSDVITTYIGTESVELYVNSTALSKTCV